MADNEIQFPAVEKVPLKDKVFNVVSEHPGQTLLCVLALVAMVAFLFVTNIRMGYVKGQFYFSFSKTEFDMDMLKRDGLVSDSEAEESK